MFLGRRSEPVVKIGETQNRNSLGEEVRRRQERAQLAAEVAKAEAQQRKLLEQIREREETLQHYQSYQVGDSQVSYEERQRQRDLDRLLDKNKAFLADAQRRGISLQGPGAGANQPLRETFGPLKNAAKADLFDSHSGTTSPRTGRMNDGAVAQIGESDRDRRLRLRRERLERKGQEYRSRVQQAPSWLDSDQESLANSIRPADSFERRPTPRRDQDPAHIDKEDLFRPGSPSTLSSRSRAEHQGLSTRDAVWEAKRRQFLQRHEPAEARSSWNSHAQAPPAEPRPSNFDREFEPLSARQHADYSPQSAPRTPRRDELALDSHERADRGFEDRRHEYVPQAPDNEPFRESEPAGPQHLAPPPPAHLQQSQPTRPAQAGAEQTGLNIGSSSQMSARDRKRLQQQQYKATLDAQLHAKSPHRQNTEAPAFGYSNERVSEPPRQQQPVAATGLTLGIGHGGSPLTASQRKRLQQQKYKAMLDAQVSAQSPAKSFPHPNHARPREPGHDAVANSTGLMIGEQRPRQPAPVQARPAHANAPLMRSYDYEDGPGRQGQGGRNQHHSQPELTGLVIGGPDPRREAALEKKRKQEQYRRVLDQQRRQHQNNEPSPSRRSPSRAQGAYPGAGPGYEREEPRGYQQQLSMYQEDAEYDGWSPAAQANRPYPPAQPPRGRAPSPARTHGAVEAEGGGGLFSGLGQDDKARKRALQQQQRRDLERQMAQKEARKKAEAERKRQEELREAETMLNFQDAEIPGLGRHRKKKQRDTAAEPDSPPVGISRSFSSRSYGASPDRRHRAPSPPATNQGGGIGALPTDNNSKERKRQAQRQLQENLRRQQAERERAKQEQKRKEEEEDRLADERVERERREMEEKERTGSRARSRAPSKQSARPPSRDPSPQPLSSSRRAALFTDEGSDDDMPTTSRSVVRPPAMPGAGRRGSNASDSSRPSSRTRPRRKHRPFSPGNDSRLGRRGRASTPELGAGVEIMRQIKDEIIQSQRELQEQVREQEAEIAELRRRAEEEEERRRARKPRKRWSRGSREPGASARSILDSLDDDSDGGFTARTSGTRRGPPIINSGYDSLRVESARMDAVPRYDRRPSMDDDYDRRRSNLKALGAMSRVGGMEHAVASGRHPFENTMTRPLEADSKFIYPTDPRHSGRVAWPPPVPQLPRRHSRPSSAASSQLQRLDTHTISVPVEQPVNESLFLKASSKPTALLNSQDFSAVQHSRPASGAQRPPSRPSTQQPEHSPRSLTPRRLPSAHGPARDGERPITADPDFDDAVERKSIDLSRPQQQTAHRAEPDSDAGVLSNWLQGSTLAPGSQPQAPPSPPSSISSFDIEKLLRRNEERRAGLFADSHSHSTYDEFTGPQTHTQSSPRTSPTISSHDNLRSLGAFTPQLQSDSRWI